MRPRGEIRMALAAAADALTQQRGCFTSRDAAHLAKVEFEVARLTLKDMERAGELDKLDRQVREQGVRRPLNLYASARGEPVADAAAELGRVVRCWADFQ